MEIPFSFELLHHSGFLQQIWQRIRKCSESLGDLSVSLQFCLIPGVPSGWQVWYSNVPPPYGSRLTERDSVGQVGKRGGKQNGETRTVCDDATEGGSLEVKFNIHVFSLQRQERERLCFLLFSPPCSGDVSATFLPLKPLHPLLSDPGRCSLTNREELLLRMVLALPKAVEMRRGAVRWLKEEEGL